MNKQTIPALLLLLLLSLLLAPAGRAWKVWHHQVIAEIAENHLQPETLREVKYLLGEKYRMSDEAGWADYIRGYWWWSAPWHYINWPLELEEPDYDVLATRRGNVVSAIEEQIAIYRDRTQSRQDRLDALKFVIHFVGDAHQPLHCGKGDDRGGNDVPVRFQGKLTNLHAAWDGAIYNDGGEKPADHAARLLKGLKPEERDRIMRGRPYDWVVESHRIAREFVYPRLEDLAVREGEVLPPELSGPYAETAGPIMSRRLIEGGLRLAYLLNQPGEDKPAPAAEATTKPETEPPAPEAQPEEAGAAATSPN